MKEQREFSTTSPFWGGGGSKKLLDDKILQIAYQERTQKKEHRHGEHMIQKTVGVYYLNVALVQYIFGSCR